jgi:hypothetical protein
VGIVWGTVGAVAAAVVTAVFLMRAPDRGDEQKIATTQKQLEDERQRLVEERRLDAQKRHLEEQERQRRQEQQAKDEEARRQADSQRKPVIPSTKPKIPDVVEKKAPGEDKSAIAKKVTPSLFPQPVPPEPVTRVPPESIALIPPKPETPPVAPTDKPPVQPTQQQELLDEANKAIASEDYSRAHKILTPIALRGNATAQVKLAEMYANGRGVGKSSPFQAYVWYSLAVRCGNSAAATERAKIAAKWQAVEVQQADKAAAGMEVCK